MKWVMAGLKKYAVFTGRARRKEFWMFYLFIFVGVIVAIILDNVLGTTIESMRYKGMGYGLFTILVYLAILIPTLAVVVRRLHDIGKSGWWICIGFIPLIGSIWLIVLLATDSQPGENQYGPNPKETV